MKKAHVPQAMHQEQVQNLLKFIDTSQDEATKKDIFYQLGYQCFHARNLDAWIGKWVGNVQGFLDWVNVEHASKYWERLEFTQDGTALVLTGKVVEGCACAFADCAQPPLSLYHHCCKNFQQELFGMLLGRAEQIPTSSGSYTGTRFRVWRTRLTRRWTRSTGC